jgi:hypothetical protein
MISSWSIRGYLPTAVVLEVRWKYRMICAKKRREAMHNHNSRVLVHLLRIHYRFANGMRCE